MGQGAGPEESVGMAKIGRELSRKRLARLGSPGDRARKKHAGLLRRMASERSSRFLNPDFQNPDATLWLDLTSSSHSLTSKHQQKYEDMTIL